MEVGIGSGSDAAAEERAGGAVGGLVGVVGAVGSLADARMKVLQGSDFLREKRGKAAAPNERTLKKIRFYFMVFFL